MTQARTATYLPFLYKFGYYNGKSAIRSLDLEELREEYLNTLTRIADNKILKGIK